MLIEKETADAFVNIAKNHHQKHLTALKRYQNQNSKLLKLTPYLTAQLEYLVEHKEFSTALELCNQLLELETSQQLSTHKINILEALGQKEEAEKYRLMIEVNRPK